eukprot:6177544-Pleurochrysis_carterae.AAC.4
MQSVSKAPSQMRRHGIREDVALAKIGCTVVRGVAASIYRRGRLEARSRSGRSARTAGSCGAYDVGCEGEHGCAKLKPRFSHAC